MKQKVSKLVVKDANGNLIQLLPQTKVDTELNQSSDFPLANSAIYSAINGIQSDLSNVENITDYTISVEANEEPVKPTPEGTTLLAGLTSSGHINVVWKSDFDDSSTKENYSVTSGRSRYYNAYNTLYDEDTINNVYAKGSSEEVTLGTFSNSTWESAFYVNNPDYGIVHMNGFDGLYYTIDVNSTSTSGYVFKLVSFADTNNFTSGTYTFCSKAEDLSGGTAPEVYIIGQVHMDFKIPSSASLSNYADTDYMAIDRNTFYIIYRLCSKEFYDYFNKYNVTVSMTNGETTITNTVSLPTINYRLLKLEERIDYLELALFDYITYEKNS